MCEMNLIAAVTNCNCTSRVVQTRPAFVSEPVVPAWLVVICLLNWIAFSYGPALGGGLNSERRMEFVLVNQRSKTNEVC